MTKLIRFNRQSPARRDVFFSKQELGQILSAYSLGVIQGDWRDYAIDRDGQMAIFSIFRSSREHPVYRFVKTVKPDQSEPVFVLVNRSKTVLTSPSLKRVMDRFQSLPRLIRN